MKQFYITTATIIILLALCAGTTNGQTGSRLIAESHYYNNPSGGSPLPHDSIQYVYPTVSTALYNEKLSFLYYGPWVLTCKTDYTYNTSNKLTYMEFQNWDTTSHSYKNGGMTYFFLNSSGYCIKDSNRLWIPTSSAYRDNTRNIYTVNSSGQITDQIYDSYDYGLGALLHTYHYANTYNSAGKPLVVLNQEWDASIHWYDHYKTTYAYDASGTKLQTITGEQDQLSSPGFLQTVYQNQYTLNTDGSIATCLSKIWNSSTSSYRNSMSIVYGYDASGNNTLETWEQWDVATSAYKPYQQYVRAYNSNNQKTTDTRMMWNASTSSYSTKYSQDNYYYEGYTIPAGVASMTSEDGKLSLAPIPTTGELHITLRWEEPQAFTAIIVDMNGRQYYTFSAAKNKEYTDNINLDNIPAGNYVLMIRGELGGTISRMITLQH